MLYVPKSEIESQAYKGFLLGVIDVPTVAALQARMQAEAEVDNWLVGLPAQKDFTEIEVHNAGV